MIPNARVLDVLEAAYRPCGAFTDTCGLMLWKPEAGHVPRGFAGALGDLTDVELVLVTAEPGDPYPEESYAGDNPRAILEGVARQAYWVLKTSNDQFHRNLRKILDACFPQRPFEQQLHRVWLTDSVLCSANAEGAYVPAEIGRECRRRYLNAQLELFPGALVVSLGSKAAYRLRGWPDLLHAYSVAPPGCNLRRAPVTWQAIAEKLAERRRVG